MCDQSVALLVKLQEAEARIAELTQEREPISHAEFSRFVQEAKDTREERDAALAMLDQAAAFWRPVARDIEHGILSEQTIRFLVQDFLANTDPQAQDRAREIGAAVAGVVEAQRVLDLAYDNKNPDGSQLKPYAWEGAQDNARYARDEAVEKLIQATGTQGGGEEG